MRSRIAIFEGPPRGFGRRGSRYGAPLFNNPRIQTFGRSSYSRYGAPLFNNPRTETFGRLGRRGYTVPPYYESSSYGPVTSGGRRAKALKRRGYRVKKGPNSPWQRKFKKTAKTCARIARGKRKGTYQSCMRQKLKGKRARK